MLKRRQRKRIRRERARGGSVLKIKSVFVLGAGASAPFGFPTGVQLTNNVVTIVKERSSHAYDLLTNSGLSFSPTELNMFGDALYYSGKNSVDAFLEYREDFLIVGKALMVVALIPFEVPETIMRYDQGNWLRYMFNQLNADFDQFSDDEIAFVTFNYDRTVEWFLATCLANSFSKTIEECKSVLEAIPIVHLHGRLGYLPWESKRGRPYGAIVDENSIRTAMAEIKIIHEDINDGRDADFAKAKELLKNAEKIYFIGFGFNKINVERLGIADLEPNKCIATTYGLTANEVGYIHKITDGKVVFDGNDCMNFCRNRVSWY
jgi:hypothetical protein